MTKRRCHFLTPFLFFNGASDQNCKLPPPQRLYVDFKFNRQNKKSLQAFAFSSQLYQQLLLKQRRCGVSGRWDRNGDLGAQKTTGKAGCRVTHGIAMWSLNRQQPIHRVVDIIEFFFPWGIHHYIEIINQTFTGNDKELGLLQNNSAQMERNLDSKDQAASLNSTTYSTYHWEQIH